MGLPAPVEREAFHQRRIVMDGYRRADGLWDIEAHLTDTKSYAFENSWRGTIAPGEPLHDMWLRLTIDLDLVIHAAEAVTDAGPYTPCGDITPNFTALQGLAIGPGWRKNMLERVGGVKGCTHLVELLGPLATTAFQATNRAREKHNAGKAVTKRPYQINACHMYKDDGPAVKERWPDFYTGK